MKVILQCSKLILITTFLFLFQPAAMASAVSDTLITTQVKAKLLSPEYRQITVETKNGVVALGGQVATQTQAAQAVKIAESVPNVVDVDPTFLKTSPSGQPIKDAYIASKIQGTYVKHNITSKGESIPVENIHVEVKNGIAYISGVVANQIQAKESVRLAQSVKGVTQVQSSLHTE